MPNFNKKISDTTVRIGEVRFSYAYVFEPRANDNGDAKYSCSILIPKSNKDAVRLVEEAIEATKERGKTGKWGGKVPKPCKSPLRDGDEERDDPVYEGMYFINASARAANKPAVKVLDGGILADALDSEDFYSGCWGAAVLNFFPYDASGNKGVGAGLQVVLKTRDDEKLSGGVNVEEALSGLYDD